MRVCSVENCNKIHFGRGYCQNHYSNFMSHGYIPVRLLRTKNDYVINGDITTINLYSVDSVKVSETMIDTEDIDRVKGYKWGTHGQGYVHNKNKHRSMLLHRLIMNAELGQEIDHINMNKLDNRKSNLRFCTRSENTINKPGMSNSSSKYKGVYWSKKKSRWTARTSKDYKHYYLGDYEIEEDAARAYDRKVKELYGQYAYLNFKEE